MKIVVDTSAIVAIVAWEAERKRIAKATYHCDCISPRSVYWECGNALVRKVRMGELPEHRLLSAWSMIPDMKVEYVDIDIEKALALALRLRVHGYDGFVLGCAQQLGTSLLTLDERMKVNAMSLELIW